MMAQIQLLDDAPKPLSAELSRQCFSVPPGFNVQLIACEPLIREPSGVVWDERGEMFVCELHGYNLEGHYDIQELNASGQLDRIVRRIQANPEAKQKADKETYSTIKWLRDLDGDGVVDEAVVWADHLPPCLGLCAVRGGILAACQTQILFLADRDGDGQADLREVWFEGFEKGPLERSINCPQWGPDNWIYFGCGAGGGTIRGKYLDHPVQLPRTDFRIRPDGTAIEPIVGSTGTMGFTFTESADRFVISTNTPGNFVAPLPWHYLERNPHHSTGRLQWNASSDQRVYPTSQPHPWRTRRSDDPEFAKFYTDRYGHSESAPNGFFTSACSPLYYFDTALPGLRGQLLACEPAQNLVHRAEVHRNGAQLSLSRPIDEKESEFLTSTDPWFHPITLSHAPDGSVVICDFYREIIEDYSAIPRYLQQQYSLINGHQHGRIWRLTHETQSKGAWFGPSADMSGLNDLQIVDELSSPRWWRRETARRLLVERATEHLAPVISDRITHCKETPALLNLLRTLQGLEVVSLSNVRLALDHSDSSVRRLGLQLAENWQNIDEELAGRVRKSLDDPSAEVRLQVALSLGGQSSQEATASLVELAQQYGDQLWMIDAILSSSSDRAVEMLALLLQQTEQLNAATEFLEPLCATIGHRRQSDELSRVLLLIHALPNQRLQQSCLKGLLVASTAPTPISLSPSAVRALKTLASESLPAVAADAARLIQQWQIESPEERLSRIERAIIALSDIQLSVTERLSAVSQLIHEPEPSIGPALVAAIPSASPQIREAILQAVFAQQKRLPALLDGLSNEEVSSSWLSSIQRNQLLEASEPGIRERAAALFQSSSQLDPRLLGEYQRALSGPRDPMRGQSLYLEHCGKCHTAHAIGHSVGPDLSAEFQRAEETIIKDVLAPSDMIAPDYVTYLVETDSGQVVTGILANESPTSITLRQAEGIERTVLRAEVEQLRSLSVSMMPDELFRSVAPGDLADIIAWLRRPPSRLMLIDEDRQFADLLTQGDGTALFTNAEAYSGRLSLAVTPPQRYSSSIDGWNFAIREHPAPGEFRYLRFAWKVVDSLPKAGAMIELAASGAWPDSNKSNRRYHAGTNSTGWMSTEVAATAPEEWSVVTVDLWQDNGDFVLTGIAPTAMECTLLLDRVELLQALQMDSADSEK